MSDPLLPNSMPFTSPTASQPVASSSILRSRQHYQCCHILVPDAEERLPAIAVQGNYYSFFRTERHESRALEVAERLHRRGDGVVITETPKAYAIWVLEPEAKPAQVKSTSAPILETPHSNQSYKILASRTQYQPCHIKVPDLDKRLAAISFDGKYYSLFKSVDDGQQAVQLVRRLNYRGDAAVITKTAKGYGIWILEPDAQLG